MPKKQISKEKISISLDKNILSVVETLLISGKFRSRSHILEYSLKKFLEEEKGN